MQQCNFGAVKLLTHEPGWDNAVVIPKLQGIEDYSRFMIRDLHRYIDTKHCLVVQGDGYVLNGSAWHDEFLQFDYIGAPWRQWRLVGNGGFSLRSKKLLQTTAQLATHTSPHPEDAWICFAHRTELEQQGIKFATFPIGEIFAFEGREYNGSTWQSSNTTIDGVFGFHSWLTPLPYTADKPLIFHHSGDAGDVIYSLATMKALGGGVLFLSPDNHCPWPKGTRVRPDQHWANNIMPLVMAQSYVWACHYTETMPANVTVDLNRFREFYNCPSDNDAWTSIFRLHLKKFGVDYPENRSWLGMPDSIPIGTWPVIVNRTHRYRNDSFPWTSIIDRHYDKMAFIGSGEEYQNFIGLGNPPRKIPYVPTKNLLEVAQVIAGAKVFIGNQSCPMAIALGMNKNVLQEIWHERVSEDKWRGNPNCILKRPNLIWEKTLLDQDDPIPADWL